jgi:hypothetical protein
MFPSHSPKRLANNDFDESYLQQIEIEKFLSRKKEKDLLEELMAKPEIMEIKPERPAEPVSEFFMDKVESLREKISHLNREIDTRFQMREQFKKEIEYQIRECAFSLRQFSPLALGYNVGVDMKRNLLERQLAGLRKDKRNVELRAWADITDLRKELRRLLDDYRDALRRYRMVG